ncbi:hypothetical protein [Hymenobacter jeollabukensis]|uniref:Copper resistance protein NlpE n=1 Tax=Hymenobacter jeollabukensis TaxID=2025313 RepID=A0A5R8WXZ1_9BACT|nr:hypothetical protein [Hymenobacter jeollabukensis]TLM97054.1 hypothetical protein FDY95_03425 [Hymenobacter jeollabukensis]
MSYRLLLAVVLGLGGLFWQLPAAAQTLPAAPAAQPLPPTAALPADSSLQCTTYAYLSFLIYDSESGPEPIVAEGVGGTLTLRPDGRFEQRLRIGLAPKTTVFERSGEYQLLGGHALRFRYLTKQGQPRTDTGTYRYDAQQGALVITIEGFPAGSRSVYTLVAGADATTPATPGK